VRIVGLFVGSAGCRSASGRSALHFQVELPRQFINWSTGRFCNLGQPVYATQTTTVVVGNFHACCSVVVFHLSLNRNRQSHLGLLVPSSKGNFPEGAPPVGCRWGCVLPPGACCSPLPRFPSGLLCFCQCGSGTLRLTSVGPPTFSWVVLFP